MTLADQGYRYVWRGPGDWRWIHPAERRPSDIDATDMDDGEFENLVRLVSM
jgi:hypothetical protein